jgi:ABC-type antimicrobial peptide transport system permease subunit
VLFFIILIGVVNTLHMTIRERTREIGTVRAIGMQRADVRWSFMMEVLLLTIISCAVGLIAGLLVIQVLSMISVEAEGILVLLLVDNHLYFLPTLVDVVKNLLIIVGIAFITAYFPAQRAAKLSVAEALRHYE